MISEYMFHRIRKLKQQGDNNTQIAKKLKIDRETVAKYLQARTTPTYTPREKPTREDLFIPFKTKVENWLDKSRELNSTEVFELLIADFHQLRLANKTV